MASAPPRTSATTRATLQSVISTASGTADHSPAAAEYQTHASSVPMPSITLVSETPRLSP
ncbi:MAG: hypothetical protein ABW219_06495 [Ilumatobacteraceae bacterium]